MMKKQGYICLFLIIIIILTACQPAQKQADSVSKDKTSLDQNAKSRKDNSQAEEKKGFSKSKLSSIGFEKSDSIQKAGEYRNFYEIYVGSFFDSNEDGIGDINGVRLKLDYIIDMGFTGIWLMPVHPSDTYHKYDVKDYYEIDSDYGNMADMEKLISECKSKNVSIILDFVVNHTADNHPWFQQATSYLKQLPEGAEAKVEDCPYLDYYYFTQDSTKGKSYHQVGNTGWYYEANFWGEMPDLNLDNQGVRQELKNIMSFWLDKGISGFRLDAVKEYYTGNATKNIEFLSWLIAQAKAKKPDVYIVGEDWGDFREIAEYYKSGIPSLFNFALATAQGKIAQVLNTNQAKHDAKSFAEAMIKIDKAFSENNPEYKDGLFIANHDNVRVANFLKNDIEKMKMAAGMYLTMTGVSFTYYGEEIGMNSSGNKDENKRMPMLWQKDGKGQPQNPKNADAFEQKAIPVATQEQDADSLIRYYQKALRLRQEIPAIAAGKVKVLEQYCNKEIAAIKKNWQGQEIIIFYNISNKEQYVDGSNEQWKPKDIVAYLTMKTSDIPKLEEQKLILPPYAIVFLDKK